MPRVLRVSGSLAIVLVAYWTYALVAVPLIEPPAKEHTSSAPNKDEVKGGRLLAANQVNELREFFAPNAWELGSPKILASDRVKLLMQDYKNLDDRRVQITPCTIVFLPGEQSGSREKRDERAIILQAPEGAILEFDEAFDLRQMKVGRLLGGRLTGPVKIRSHGGSSGAGDELSIVTRDVELSEYHVWTTNAVDFQLGPHHGRGRQMRIKLLPGDETSQAGEHGPNIAGVEMLQVHNVERLHLELKEDNAQSPGNPAPAAGTLAAMQQRPVEITCDGRFQFDVLRKIATFKKNVNVLRINRDGPADQINCEQLSIFFTERDKRGSKRSRRPRPAALELQPTRIEARGNPVVVNAPSEEFHARGQLLQYDLQAERIILDGDREVTLRRGKSEIHARRLDYQSGGDGRLGQILAEGPGWLRGLSDDRPDEPLEARWGTLLQVRPHEQNQVISLSGSAELQFHGIGRLSASEIHFWLFESAAETPDGRPQLQPDRMLARNDVRVRSEQLTGAVEQLEVWFQQAGATATGGQPNAAAPPPTGGSAWRPTSTGKNALSATGNAAKKPQQHFDVSGRLLRARVLLQEDRQAELSELTIEDDVRFVETQTARAGERPVLVSGDRLHVTGAATPHAAVTVTGGPARFEGRGLGLSGSNINLNRGTNRLWIDGAGRMELPLDRDLEGRPLRHPESLHVEWKHAMEFDGRTAQFEESVTAATTHQYLRTELLEVQMQRPIRFAESKLDDNSKVEQIACRGGVFMQNRAFEGELPVSLERMQVADLTIRLIDGAVTAAGPGWLNSVWRGSGNPLDLDLGTRPGGGDRSTRSPGRHRVARPATGGEQDKLVGLHVRFRGSIKGNLHRRQMTFRDQVETIYAPVDSWQAKLDPRAPDAPGPDGVTLNCDQLSVVEMTTPAGPSRELEAVGNTVVEGETFTARAARLTYAEAKGMLVLEGDGRADAKLFRQQQVGGSTSEAAAQKIYYWPKTKRLKIEGARSLELNRIPGIDPRK